jgi:Sigma-70, region 4
VILLVGLEEMGYEEAAKILGIPVGTVRSRLSHLTEDSHLRFCTVWFCATLGNAQRNIHSGDAG